MRQEKDIADDPTQHTNGFGCTQPNLNAGTRPNYKSTRFYAFNVQIFLVLRCSNPCWKQSHN